MLVRCPYILVKNVWGPLMKSFYMIVICLMIIVLGVPSVIVFAFGSNKTSQNINDVPTIMSPLTPIGTNAENITLSVFRMNNNDIENMFLEEYLIGVVASEMPASYELEALKAQAISARTYILKFLMTENEGLPKSADITDSTIHQVYKDSAELKKIWKEDYSKYINKITQAVKETEGLIMTYNGELIDSTFFAISNGYTENSEDYWKVALPYLRSVPSPWDKNSPDFNGMTKITSGEFESKLGVKLTSDIKLHRTSTNRVSIVTINGKEFSGDEFRTALGLRSTDFSFKVVDDSIEFTTQGYGHGVGMSQYGANSLAMIGNNHKEILEYYYKDIKIEKMKSLQGYKDLVVKRSENH